MVDHDHGEQALAQFVAMEMAAIPAPDYDHVTSFVLRARRAFGAHPTHQVPLARMSPAVWAAFVVPREVTGARKGTRSPAEHWHGANFVSAKDQKDRCVASALGTLTFNTFPGAGQRSAFYGRQAIDLSTGYTVLPEAEPSYGDTDSAESAMDTEKTDHERWRWAD